jgi:hypothetical protein
MSIYFSIDGGTPIFLASNTGWGDFCRWSDSDGVGDPVKHLCQHGYYEPLSELLPAIVNSPSPDDDTVLVTLSDFVDLLTGEDDDAVITINDGMTTSQDTDADQ